MVIDFYVICDLVFIWIIQIDYFYVCLCLYEIDLMI